MVSECGAFFLFGTLSDRIRSLIKENFFFAKIQRPVFFFATMGGANLCPSQLFDCEQDSIGLIWMHGQRSRAPRSFLSDRAFVFSPFFFSRLQGAEESSSRLLPRLSKIHNYHLSIVIHAWDILAEGISACNSKSRPIGSTKGVGFFRGAVTISSSRNDSVIYRVTVYWSFSSVQACCCSII